MINNFEVLNGLIESKLPKKIQAPLSKLTDSLAERIITSPASSRSNFVGAFAGGLVWHNLNVLRIMKDLNKVHGEQVSKEDMIVTALFHNLGRIGTEDEDLYVAAKSDWHKENGYPFQINPSLPSFSVPAMSLWWLQKFEVPMSYEAVSAIVQAGDLENSSGPNVLDSEPLAMLLQQSVWTATVLNKSKEQL